TSGETMQSLNNASRRCAHVSAIFSPPGFALPKWGAGREAIVFTTRYVMQWGAKEGQTVGLDRRVMNRWFPIGVLRHGQALPLHPRVEDPQDEIKDAIIAQFALWPALGHREVWQDKCGELRFGKLDGNRRRCRLWCHGAHDAIASYEDG